MNEKTIYELKLHECLTIDSTTEVQRVEGGWIYTKVIPPFQGSGCVPLGSVFVPFNNEFQVYQQLMPAEEPKK